MNEVKKCSLSGIAFTMDIDAYKELSNYIGSLKESYKESPDGAEIVADIEARIAELILTTQAAERVVELPLIKNIIQQMGTAEDINTDDDQPHHSNDERLPRRLYRDTKNAKLGGVCAGIGRYFDIDPVWVRLAFFAPLILFFIGSLPYLYWLERLMGNLFGVCCISYLVMWFAIPAARTARQLLEMNGSRITAQSISAQTEQLSSDPDTKARTVVADSVSLFGKVVLIVLKLFAGLIVFGLVMLAVALLIGLISIAVAGHEMVPVDIAVGLPISGIVVLLLPVVAMIYVLMCLIASRHPNGKALVVMVIAWLIAIATLTTYAVRERPMIQEAIESVHDTEIEIDGETINADELLLQIEEEGELKINGRVKIKHKGKHKKQSPATAGITIDANDKAASAQSDSSKTE